LSIFLLLLHLCISEEEEEGGKKFRKTQSNDHRVVTRGQKIIKTIPKIFSSPKYL